MGSAPPAGGVISDRVTGWNPVTKRMNKWGGKLTNEKTQAYT